MRSGCHAKPNASLAAWTHINELFDRYGCEHAYLDVGTNIGVQLRKLYEPSLYPSAPVHRIFDGAFGKGSRCRVCAVGMEPSPNRRSRLEELQRRYTALGFPVIVLKGAASDCDGTVRFGACKPPCGDHASSSLVLSKDKRVFTVPSHDVAQLVRLLDWNLRGRPADGGSPPLRGRRRLVMKLDVEGVEGYVLRRMAATPIAGEQSALCAVDSLYIEWHEQNTHLRLPKRARAQLAASHAWFAHRYMNASRHRGRPACRLQTYELDDETAIGDGKPWPSAWIPAWLPYWLPAWVPLPRGV